MSQVSLSLRIYVLRIETVSDSAGALVDVIENSLCFFVIVIVDDDGIIDDGDDDDGDGIDDDGDDGIEG